LYVISTGSSQYVRNDTVGSTSPSRRMDSTGMFWICYKETDKGNEVCNFIPQDCVPDTYSAFANCDTFNAIRAFNILALLFTGFKLIPQLVYACLPDNHPKKAVEYARSKRYARYTAAAFGFVAGTFGMISMACGLDYYDQHGTPVYGFSFWLQVVAWLVSYKSAALYSMAGCANDHDDESTHHRHAKGPLGFLFGVGREHGHHADLSHAHGGHAHGAAAPAHPAPEAKTN